MTKQQWTTPAERVLLISKYHAWKETANNPPARSKFLTDLYNEFTGKFPLQEPSEELIEKHKYKSANEERGRRKSKKPQPVVNGAPATPVLIECTREEAVERAQKFLQTQLYNRLSQWFGNYTRTIGVSSSEEPGSATRVLSLIPKKKPQLHHAWYGMKRAELQPLLHAQWDEYCAENSGKKKMTWISFFNKWCTDGFAKEDDATKMMVNDFRETYDELKDPNEPEQDRNLRYNHALSKLKPTVLAAIDAIAAQTGWSTIILSGGPHPGFGGEMKAIFESSEVTGVNGKKIGFLQWLKETRGDKVQQWYSDYLTAVYGGPAELKKYAIVGDEGGDVDDDDEDAEDDVEVVKVVEEEKDRADGSGVKPAEASPGQGKSNIDPAKANAAEPAVQPSDGGLAQEVVVDAAPVTKQKPTASEPNKGIDNEGASNPSAGILQPSSSTPPTSTVLPPLSNSASKPNDGSQGIVEAPASAPELRGDTRDPAPPSTSAPPSTVVSESNSATKLSLNGRDNATSPTRATGAHQQQKSDSGVDGGPQGREPEGNKEKDVGGDDMDIRSQEKPKKGSGGADHGTDDESGIDAEIEATSVKKARRKSSGGKRKPKGGKAAQKTTPETSSESSDPQKKAPRKRKAKQDTEPPSDPSKRRKTGPTSETAAAATAPASSTCSSNQQETGRSKRIRTQSEKVRLMLL